MGSIIVNPYLQSGDYALSDLVAVNFYAFLERFFFDNIFNIIVVYVIFNMLAGFEKILFYIKLFDNRYHYRHFWTVKE